MNFLFPRTSDHARSRSRIVTLLKGTNLAGGTPALQSAICRLNHGIPIGNIWKGTFQTGDETLL